MTDRFKRDVEEFNLSFDNLCVSIEDIKSGMGYYKNEIPELFLRLIKKNLSSLSAIMDIKGGYCIYDKVITPTTLLIVNKLLIFSSWSAILR